MKDQNNAVSEADNAMYPEPMNTDAATMSNEESI